MIKYFITIVLCGLAFSSNAQQNGSKAKLAEVANFFEGKWIGQGQFANRRKIAATVEFKLSLDSCWLMYSHTDKLPNHYKATSMWGIDKPAGKFLAYVFDNFQGHRLFTSNGWVADSLVLVNKDTSVPNTSFLQRFIYVKKDANHFHMAYEVSKDSINWKLGDSLLFVRQSP